MSAKLANERLAIMAVIGMVLQDGLTGSTCGAGALFTAFPLRAFNNELGVQAPMGFGDPAGFTADGNYENFAKQASWQIIGMFLQEGLTGSACGACALYTASPLRALGNELGVQAPVGFLILLASRLREATRISLRPRICQPCSRTKGWPSWQSSAWSSWMASLALPVAQVPCSQHLRCARSITSLAFRRQ